MGKATSTNGPLLQAKVATHTTAKSGVITAFTVSHNGQRDVPLTAPRKEPRSLRKTEALMFRSTVHLSFGGFGSGPIRFKETRDNGLAAAVVVLSAQAVPPCPLHRE
jgi:hypothetical protein